MSFAGLLKDTMTIRRWATTSTDDYGQPVKTWSNQYTNVPCRYEQTKTAIEIQTEKELVITRDRIFTEQEGIRETDRVVVNGLTFEVLLVRDVSDGTERHHSELFLRRAKAE